MEMIHHLGNCAAAQAQGRRRGAHQRSSLFFRITLGNPRQNCRHFGICRAEPWEAAASPPLTGNQCVAQALPGREGERKIGLLFLNEYLIPRFRTTYFNAGFIVDAPFWLPDSLSRVSGAPGYAILPGSYPLVEAEKGILVGFDIGIIS